MPQAIEAAVAEIEARVEAERSAWRRERAEWREAEAKLTEERRVAGRRQQALLTELDEGGWRGTGPSGAASHEYGSKVAPRPSDSHRASAAYCEDVSPEGRPATASGSSIPGRRHTSSAGVTTSSRRQAACAALLSAAQGSESTCSTRSRVDDWD